MSRFCHRLIAILTILVGPAHAGEMTLPMLARKLKSSVFQVETFDRMGDKTGLGTGFFVNGRAITNHHVIVDAAKIVCILDNGARLEASGVFDWSQDADLAMLAIPPDRKGLQLRTSPPEVGERAIVYGNPQGYTGTLSEGIVSALRKSGAIDIVQYTAPTSPGSSGSPVVDSGGLVIGVATAVNRSGQALNFAVAGKILENFLSSARTDFISPIPTSLDREMELEKLRSEAIAALRRQNHAEAIATFTDLINRAPSDLYRHEELASAYLMARMYHEAAAVAKEVRKVAPEREGPLLTLAACHVRAHQFDRAFKTLESARKITPNSGRADLHIALLLRSLGRNKEAEVPERRGQTLSKEWLEDRYGRGWFRGERGSFIDLKTVATDHLTKYEEPPTGEIVLTRMDNTLRFRQGSRLVLTSGGPLMLRHPVIKYGPHYLVTLNDSATAISPLIAIFDNPTIYIEQFFLLPYPGSSGPDKKLLEAFAAEINAALPSPVPGIISVGDGAPWVSQNNTARTFGIYVGEAGPGRPAGVYHPQNSSETLRERLTSVHNFAMATLLNNALAIEPPPGEFRSLPEEPRERSATAIGPLRTALVDKSLTNHKLAAAILISRADLNDPEKRRQIAKGVASALSKVNPEQQAAWNAKSDSGQAANEPSHRYFLRKAFGHDTFASWLSSPDPGPAAVVPAPQRDEFGGILVDDESTSPASPALPRKPKSLFQNWP